MKEFIINTLTKLYTYKNLYIFIIHFTPFLQTTMNWLWPTQKKALDKDRVYIKIQFLTQQQKVKKDLALQQLSQRFKEDEETIIPYEDYFSCSYRFVFNAKQSKLQTNQKQQLLLKEIIGNIILSTNEKTKQFYQTHINGIQVIMQNNQSLANNDLIGLFDERQVSLYNPPEVLQIIYIQKSLWEIIKKKTKKIIKNIPSALCTLLQKIFGFVLVMLGLNGGVSSLIWKVVPIKMILQWLSVLVMMFFPALAPILGIGKMLL